jgi:hypothetical protein
MSSRFRLPHRVDLTKNFTAERMQSLESQRSNVSGGNVFVKNESVSPQRALCTNHKRSLT